MEEKGVPADEGYGIPRQRWGGLLNHKKQKGVARFTVSMCSSSLRQSYSLGLSLYVSHAG